MSQLLDAMARLWQRPPVEPLVIPTRDFLALQTAEHRNRALTARLNAMSRELAEAEVRRAESAGEMVAELLEARQMAGAGPWRVSPAAIQDTDRLIGAAIESVRTGAKFRESLALRENTPAAAQGAYGDIQLALENVEWRREINLSFLEFSRWGIQQIILISRLHYIKNPWIRRGVEIAACYVFGRGVEISSENDAANGVIQDYLERNKETLGQIGLTDLMRRKYYDGNVFFVSFPDTAKTGAVETRTIDGTEIQEIVCDQDDVDRPWLYRRQWTAQVFSQQTGDTSSESQEAWYPSLSLWMDVNGLSGYDPKPDAPTPAVQEIRGKPVHWNAPVLHRKCGTVAKWHFGCPLVYAALDWAKAGKRFLEACATVKAALAQIAMTLTTKGGQQAIEGAKAALSTTVGPDSNLLDQNPTAVNASIFAAGTGTTLSAFKTSGAGGDPKEVTEFRNMVACVLGIPPTYLADMETSNLATATTLDRPTELGFLEKQEEWREDLITLCKFVLAVSKGASRGRIRESLNASRIDPAGVVIREARRALTPRGNMVYIREAKTSQSTEITVKVDFPSIREGDIPQLVDATFKAMAIDRQGTEHGLDQKTAFRQFCKLLAIEDADELAEEVYPDAAYQKDRTALLNQQIKMALAPPPAPVAPGAQPGAPPAAPKAQQPGAKAMEAFNRLVEAIRAR